MTTQTDELIELPTTDEGRRALAVKRIRAKSEFKTHLVVYVCVNAMLILIWLFTSMGRPLLSGFFWPIIPMAGWGIGLALHGYSAYRGGVYTEEQVQRELKQLPQ